MSAQNETPLSEMMSLAELNPNCSLLQIYSLFRHGNWQIEDLTVAQKDAYQHINGLKALQQMCIVVERFKSRFPLNAPAQRKQWLATGNYIHIRNILSPRILENLLTICDRNLNRIGTPPLKITDISNIIESADLQSIAALALSSLPAPSQHISHPSILKKRTLLRRTFPPSHSFRTVGNMNNQRWHQDSNMQFNDSPMLTLWIPLQNNCGVSRPSIQILSCPVSFFSVAHGDSSTNIQSYLNELFPDSQVFSIFASTGDCVIFNGLTFHQTLSTAAMSHYRDTLLIRVIDKTSAYRFPVHNIEEELLDIG
jgi:hypothetical protein